MRNLKLMQPHSAAEHGWLNPPMMSPVNSARDLRWLERAGKVAAMADGRWRVGCVLVRGGRVLAAASNVVRNEPSACADALWLSSEHAEMGALRLAGNPTGATAYVARIDRNGSWRHAQPCKRCQLQLDAAQVRAVWSSDPAYVSARSAC